MKNNSRIRFNPVTKEIEIEGSESFVKTYFDKLQALMPTVPEREAVIKKRPKAANAAPGEKATKRVTNIDTVIGLIQDAPEGISTAELKNKTGFIERQIWSIVNRASKEGRIRKMKRGMYCAVAEDHKKKAP